MRRAQSNERGHEIHAAGIRDRYRQFAALGRRLDDSKLIAQPLDRRAGNEDASFDGKLWRGVSSGGARRQQLMLGNRLPRSSMHQCETAGSISVLRKSRPETALAKQRSLLITRNTGDQNSGSQMFGRRGADDETGGNNPR